jgi:hypothetical protein
MLRSDFEGTCLMRWEVVIKLSSLQTVSRSFGSTYLVCNGQVLDKAPPGGPVRTSLVMQQLT